MRYICHSLSLKKIKILLRLVLFHAALSHDWGTSPGGVISTNFNQLVWVVDNLWKQTALSGFLWRHWQMHPETKFPSFLISFCLPSHPANVFIARCLGCQAVYKKETTKEKIFFLFRALLACFARHRVDRLSGILLLTFREWKILSVTSKLGFYVPNN